MRLCVCVHACVYVCVYVCMYEGERLDCMLIRIPKIWRSLQGLSSCNCQKGLNMTSHHMEVGLGRCPHMLVPSKLCSSLSFEHVYDAVRKSVM